MLTRNYYHIMERLLTGYSGGYPSAADRTVDNWLADKYMLVKEYGGSIATVDPDISAYGVFGYDADNKANVSSSTAIGWNWLLVGSSDAEETYDDYTIEFVTTLTAQGNRASTYEYTHTGTVMHTNKVFVNNTTEDVVIKEIGMFTGTGVYVGSSNSRNARPVLVYRKKLDEPITIPANGGVANIALDINIPAQNKPSA